MKRWDIFCRIIDNYGDIGVCWRLAKQLAHEHKLAVRLWVDDLEVAKRLISGLNTGLESQIIDGIEVCHWQPSFKSTSVADVVIEVFACELPASYLAAMVKTKPAWLNLEYLTAEQWAAESHLLASPHPTLPLTKHFFFPGFDAKTGGLIRESGLIEKRDTFQHDSQAQAAFRKRLGLIVNESLKISLFCYPYAPLAGLLEAIASGTRPTTVFVSDSNTLATIGDQLGLGQIMVGDHISKGNLALQALPFLTQDDYDYLLWDCDINFVRGEDSWMRALWAAKPFIWLPYLQSENAHITKLNAFLDAYTTDLPENARTVLLESHLTWCSDNYTKTNWLSLLGELPALQKHAAKIANKLASQPDLAAKLVIFCKNFSK